MHIYNCEKIRHRQRYKAVAIDFVICPQKNKANITYNKATVKNKANIRQFWGVVKIRQTARNTPEFIIFLDLLKHTINRSSERSMKCNFPTFQEIITNRPTEILQQIPWSRTSVWVFRPENHRIFIYLAKFQTQFVGRTNTVTRDVKFYILSVSLIQKYRAQLYVGVLEPFGHLRIHPDVFFSKKSI